MCIRDSPCKFQPVSRLGSVTARHSSTGRQPYFAALNRRRHLYSAGRPSRWALAHIPVAIILNTQVQSRRQSKKLEKYLNEIALPAVVFQELTAQQNGVEPLRNHKFYEMEKKVRNMWNVTRKNIITVSCSLKTSRALDNRNKYDNVAQVSS